MRYRPEIDGLRAVAVIPVILYHAGLPGAAGGYVGVDVFFVISGYLITSLLLADLEAGRFSILRFYDRRARRILPALVAVILVSMPFAWAWMGPPDLAKFFASITAAGLFASNILFWQTTGYFDGSVEIRPLIHTWSLAVEEQFYILFPPVLWLLWARLRAHLTVVIGILALASLALCVILTPQDRTLAFYLAPTRAWELLAGALCARVIVPRQGAWSQAGAAAGLGLILLAIANFDSETIFPGAAALLPVAGTVLVILFAQGPGPVTSLLRFPPIVLVGLVSYSAYLVHQPLFAFARLREGAEPDLPTMLALSAASILLGAVSWRFVERPFRLRQGEVEGTRPSRVVAISAAVLAVLATIGVSGWTTGGLPGRDPRIATLFQEAERSFDSTEGCTFIPGFDPVEAERCLIDAGPDGVVLWGDSHARSMSVALRTALEAEGRALTVFIWPGCLPVPGTERVPRPPGRRCDWFNDAVLRTLENRAGPLVIAARWPVYLEEERFDNGLGGRDPGAPVRVGVTLSGETVVDPSALRERISSFLEDVSSAGPVVVMGPVPETGWDVPRRAAALIRRDGPDVSLAGNPGLVAERARSSLRLLQDSESDRLVVLDPADALCRTVLPDGCVQFASGTLYYGDDNHPAPPASRLIALRLVELLTARDW